MSRLARLARLLVVGACAAVAALTGGCEPRMAGDIAGRKIRATATVGMVADTVRVVGGERVEVVSLMGPGVDPHLYKASQGDVEALLEADAIFYNGLFLEGQMGDVLVKAGQQTPTVRVTQDIPEHELLKSVSYEGQADPHVWFDATLWRETVGPVVA